MFLSPQLAYVELEKTGGTYIIRQLQRLFPESSHGDKHIRPDEKYMVPGRTFLGSVRNPWDWYISLWAYGCDGKGSLLQVAREPLRFHSRKAWLTRPLETFALWRAHPRYAPQWTSLHRDSRDAQAFREWLRLMHDPGCMAWYDPAYGRAPLSSWAGYMTYRHLDLCCRRPGRLFSDRAATLSSALAFERDNGYVQHFIHNETLDDDLIAALQASSLALTPEQQAQIRSAPKTNKSSRKGGVDYYYDAATLDLVTQREQFIIRRFEYQEPVLNGD